MAEELRSAVPGARAEEILRESGARTGAYVNANRMPAPSRFLLRVEGPYPGTLVLEGTPACREGGGPNPSGSHYEAAFQTLLERAAPGIRVREVTCRAGGAPACRFHLEIPVKENTPPKHFRLVPAY